MQHKPKRRRSGMKGPSGIALLERIQPDAAGIVAALTALTGNYRAEHLFALKQNFAAYKFLLQQIAECDSEIEAVLTTLAAQQPPPAAMLPAPRRRAISKHQPQFDLRSPLHRLTEWLP